MRNTTAVSRALFRSSAVGALAIIASVAAPAQAQARAQDAPASPTVAAEDDESENEPIVVTGSRIQREDLTSSAPVTALGIDVLTAAGSTSGGDVISFVPALFGSVSSDLSATRGTLIGGTQLNLRNLGAERTLVLVNGRRHVAASPGTAIVDVDTIPAVLIQRVDVLTGGASAVYGSDAVSGVVNYIMRRDFTGFEIEGQAGVTQEGDGTELFLSGAYGIDLGGRGNITVSAQYRNESSISAVVRLMRCTSPPDSVRLWRSSVR